MNRRSPRSPPSRGDCARRLRGDLVRGCLAEPSRPRHRRRTKRRSEAAALEPVDISAPTEGATSLQAQIDALAREEEGATRDARGTTGRAAADEPPAPEPLVSEPPVSEPPAPEPVEAEATLPPGPAPGRFTRAAL